MSPRAVTYLPECKLREARKRYVCEGNGAGGDNRRYALGCAGVIYPGDRYVEYLGQSHAYESGSRHCVPCGEAFYTEQANTGPIG